MTEIDPNYVGPHEHGLIRIYGIELPASQIDPFAGDGYMTDEDADWPVMTALGATYLDSDFVEVFDVETLEAIGLSGYLTIGNGVSEADVAPYKEMLESVQGHVLMVFTAAFGGFEQTLSPVAPLRHIATFREEGASVTFEPLPDESAKTTEAGAPTHSKKKPSDAAMSGRIATIALLVMGVLVWVMIKVGG